MISVLGQIFLWAGFLGASLASVILAAAICLFLINVSPWTRPAVVGASLGELEFVGFPGEIAVTGDEVQLD